MSFSLNINESEIFQSYEQDFKKYTSDLGSRLIKMADENRTNANLMQEKSRLDIEEAKIQQMENELNSYPQKKRGEIKQKIKEYKRQLEQMINDYNGIYIYSREEREMDSLNESDVLKQLRNQNSLEEQLNEQNFKLIAAKHEAYQIEGNAINTQKNLVEQTGKLDKMKKKVIDIKNQLNLSNNLIETMSRNIKQRKMILYLVAACFFMAIMIILFNNFISNEQNSQEKSNSQE